MYYSILRVTRTPRAMSKSSITLAGCWTPTGVGELTLPPYLSLDDILADEWEPIGMIALGLGGEMWTFRLPLPAEWAEHVREPDTVYLDAYWNSMAASHWTATINYAKKSWSLHLPAPKEERDKNWIRPDDVFGPSRGDPDEEVEAAFLVRYQAHLAEQEENYPDNHKLLQGRDVEVHVARRES